MPKADKFSVGDLVFAKVKGYPPWPARVTGLGSKEKYKIYFYGTYETASLKSEDIWRYNAETEARFGPKYIKKKGYQEGLYQIANTPDICPVEEFGGFLPGDDSSQDLSVNLDDSAQKLPSPPKTAIKGERKISAAASEESLVGLDSRQQQAHHQEQQQQLPDRGSQQQQPERTGVKRKAPDGGGGGDGQEERPPAKRPHLSADKLVRGPGGRFAKAVPAAAGGGNSVAQSQTPGRMVAIAAIGASGDAERPQPEESPKKPQPQESVLDLGEGRRLWVKVRDTDDLIEINLDKDRPDTFQSEQARAEWEAASARKALKFKKRVESGDFVPPEIQKKLEERAARSQEDQEAMLREKRLQRSKQKLRWLQIEQRLVELYITIKTSLNLERPSPDRCIAALDELHDLVLLPLMLKKQPDIVVTVRKLRNYVGPKNLSSWPDEDARNRIERSVGIIQSKAEEIYQKFRRYFPAPGQSEETFLDSFLKEVEEFRDFTKTWDERKVLSMTRDPTRPVSSLNPVSDDEEEED